jgi:hypothetical protein
VEQEAILGGFTSQMREHMEQDNWDDRLDTGSVEDEPETDTDPMDGASEEAFWHWARSYDELNGTPEDDGDR